MEAQSIKPPDWAGTWDFSHAQLEAPLQVYVRDSKDASNRAMLGINPAKRPDVWATWKAMEANPVEPVFSQSGNRVAFDGLWDGCSWTLDIAPHSLKDTITIKDKAIAPKDFRWTIKLSPGATLDARADGIHLLDSDGVSQGQITYPVAWDGNGSDMDHNIRVAMSFGEPIGPFLQMILTPNAVDVAASVGDVVIDPTTVIQGAPDIEDALIFSSVSDANWGGRPDIIVSNTIHALSRVAASALPAGTIDDFRHVIRVGGIASINPLELFFIKDANDWVEGTNNGTTQVGSCSWNHAKNATQSWAGSAGCSTSGTDFEASGSPPSEILPANSFVTFTLPTVWASDWRDAVKAANGHVGFMVDASNNKTWFSTEQAGPSIRPAYEVDFTTGPAGAPFLFLSRRR